MNISSRHSNSNFAHSFDFIALLSLRKVSTCRGWFIFDVSLLCTRSMYTLKSAQWITIIMVNKIWVGMSTTNILLLQFKSQSHLQNGDYKCRYSRTHSKEKASEIFNITFAILSFCYQNTLTKLPSSVLWSLLLLIKPLDALQNDSL